MESRALEWKNLAESYKKIRKGKKVYENIHEKYGNKTIYINQHPALGDAFMASLYLTWVDEKKDCVIVCIGAGSVKVYQNRGFENIVFLSQTEVNALVSYCHFISMDRKDAVVLHHQALEWKTGIAWNVQGVRKINFHDLMRAMVFPDCPRMEWKPLEYRGKGVFEEIHKGKSVILFPYANTLYTPAMGYLDSIARELKKRGYYVYTYTDEKEQKLLDTENFFCELEELVPAVTYAGGFVGVRNGLMDMVCGADCKKMILYPKYGAESWIQGRIMDYWSVKSFGYTDDACEVEWAPGCETVREDGELWTAMDQMFPRVEDMETA